MLGTRIPMRVLVEVLKVKTITTQFTGYREVRGVLWTGTVAIFVASGSS